MTTLLIIQSIGILIFFLSIIVLACMAVHYACTRFKRLRFGFYFCLEARDQASVPSKILTPESCPLTPGGAAE